MDDGDKDGHTFTEILWVGEKAAWHDNNTDWRHEGNEHRPDPGAASAAEQQILLLARQQAQREEEVLQCRRHIEALQEEIAELEQENRLRAQQEMVLKEELREIERANKRANVDVTYLKNVVLKLLHTGEVPALLPVLSMLLQFSPEEVRKCQEMYEGQETAAAAATPSTPTLFSAFAFSPKR
eukprot:TRINITY_DN3526_c0_g2_i1.p1 TRINITY_DN3526_c0_g2~~TRINITY_DN3526_c0_g2_i1.p1  ORF type:complete len:190 (-),score=67.23 TRINITY_DN3526_c0_g2_i1:201-749(-)